MSNHTQAKHDTHPLQLTTGTFPITFKNVGNIPQFKKPALVPFHGENYEPVPLHQFPSKSLRGLRISISEQ